MSKRKNAGKGYGMMFHGAFGSKSDAKKKERQVHGFIQPRNIKGERRYVVMSERKNPIKRKKKKYDAIEELNKFLSGEPSRLPGAARTPEQEARHREKVERAIAKVKEKVRRAQEENPHELLVMGANPSGAYSPRAYSPREPREIVVPPGSTITIRTNPTNPDRYTSAQATASGARYHPPALIKTKRQKRVAGMVRKARKHKYDWIPLEGLVPGQNPGDDVWMYQAVAQLFPSRSLAQLSVSELSRVAQLAAQLKHSGGRRRNNSAADLREEFTGMASESYVVENEPHMPRGDYAQLGTLLALYFKPVHGGQVHSIIFVTKKPLLVSDESGRQLWFVGGDQDITSALAPHHAVDRGDGSFELGEARRIDYKQRKEHVKDPSYDEWRHEFGEENGARPTLLFDSRHKRLLLEGGDYRIQAEGIIN